MKLPLCKCGCGNPVSKPENKYVNGHIWRGRSNNRLGIKHTEETKKKMSKSHIGKQTGPDNPAYGKKMSKETCRKKSKAMKGRFLKEENPFYGKKHTPETKRRMSEVKRGENAWNWKEDSDEKYCSIFRNKEFRQIIYQRDSNSCQLCGCTRQLNFKLHGHKRLSIHHINHNKKDCNLRNCISLCVPCNGRVEGRKKKLYYESYLRERVKLTI